MKQPSWKSNPKHAVLQHLIEEIDPNQDMSRAGITNRAIIKAKNLPKESWIKVMEGLPKLPKLEIPVPTAMQVKIDEELEKDLEIVEEDIKRSLGLKTLQTQYEIQLLWLNYLNCLKEDAMNVGEDKLKDEDLTGPDMVKRLVQILLLNREADKSVIEKVKTALLEWEE